MWNKARKAEGLDDSIFRLDACGALIMRDKFGKKNPYGWVIDHILPLALGGDDREVNLRALHYQNNLSKADNYPSYLSAVQLVGEENVPSVRSLTVNPAKRQQLREMGYQNA